MKQAKAKPGKIFVGGLVPELEDELAPISDEETRSVIKVEEFMDKMLSINLITGSSLV